MRIDKHPTPVRDYGIDNLRCILMACVVLGHLLEICTPFPGSELLYRVIYSFHMPAFVFLTGYFARYDPRRIVSDWVIPYAVFQTLYLWFAESVLQRQITWQYTTPYWLLWYLLACIFYQLLLPMYHTGAPRVALTAVSVLALLAGFDTTVGYYATLSRFLVFQPWFVLGYYAQKYPRQPRGVKAFSTVGVMLAVVWLYHSPITDDMLYGSYAYAKLNYSALLRLGMMAAALAWVVFLMTAVRPLLPRKIPVITAIGQNTLSIYLLHGFVLRAIPKFWPGLLSTPLRVFAVLAGIILLFGNPWVGKAFRGLFTCFQAFDHKESA